jgi:predicted ATPase/class 3 adenylate cyclase
VAKLIASRRALSPELRARQDCVMVLQPQGLVTLVFTDIEGSTRLLGELGEDVYTQALAEHRRVVREAFARHNGYEVDYEGDAFFYAFPVAGEAVAAVKEALAGLDQGPIRVRVGIHTGTPGLDPPKYVGLDVHLAARIMSAGHGGQVLLSQATRGHVQDAAVTDLGEHRLKDFAGPVSLFQLGNGRFPPLKTISNTNLPRPASSFVGRAREVAEAASLIREGARLVTLTGPGGSGKTRLAIEAASELVPDFKAGVFWVALATIHDPALVVQTIAQTVGAREELRAHIGTRELLLLLDNLEQVIDAAPELAAIVESCPNIVLLVTSRELLRVRGEVEYEVLPLAEPDAVALFSARAQLPSSEAVEELCRRLDNIPLALELAAARTKVLSPAQILERLSQRLDLFKGGRDADPRQQTLRATIDWSYDLLSKHEQLLFARLSVFAGGATLDAAEQVCAADLETLQSLVEKSLLRHTNDRVWMLETIREYARERLPPGELQRLEQCLSRWIRRLVEVAEPRLRGAGQKEWCERLDAEQPNLRVALASSLAVGGEDAAAIAAAVWRFWYVRGRGTEGRAWLEAALRVSPLGSALRGGLLNALGVLAWIQGDIAHARRCQENSLELFESAGDRTGALHALGDLAVIEISGGNHERGLELLESVASRARALGDAWSLASSLQNIATLRLYRGELDEAEEAFEKTSVAAAQAEDAALQALAGSGSGHVALARGDSSTAGLRFRAAAATALEVGAQIVLADTLEGLAAVYAAEEPESSGRFLGCAEAIREETDIESDPQDRALVDSYLIGARGTPAFEAARQEGRLLSPEDVLSATDSRD